MKQKICRICSNTLGIVLFSFFFFLYSVISNYTQDDQITIHSWHFFEHCWKLDWGTVETDLYYITLWKEKKKETRKKIQVSKSLSNMLALWEGFCGFPYMYLKVRTSPSAWQLSPEGVTHVQTATPGLMKIPSFSVVVFLLKLSDWCIRAVLGN